MSITAEQVARKMGISNATVSRVLNNSQHVSPETREAVLTMIRANGGVPRVLGRRPKRTVSRPVVAQSGLVEILMVNRFPIQNIEAVVSANPSEPEQLASSAFFSPSARMATSFMRHIINGIIDEIRHYNMRAVVQVCDNLSAPAILHDANQSGNRGLFLLGVYDQDVHDFIAKCRVPIVSYMTWAHNGWPDYIGIDNSHGIRMAFEHLYELGHRKIGYLAGQLCYSAVFRERLNAYKSCLLAADLPYRPDWIIEGSCQMRPMETDAEKVLSMEDRPTAMICCFDGGAVAVNRVAVRLGLRVPTDLSIVGFDDEDIAQLMTPALTTVRVPTALMGRQGVHVMLLRQQMPARPGEAFNIRVMPKLIVRQSTASPTER